MRSSRFRFKYAESDNGISGSCGSGSSLGLCNLRRVRVFTRNYDARKAINKSSMILGGVVIHTVSTCQVIGDKLVAISIHLDCVLSRTVVPALRYATPVMIIPRGPMNFSDGFDLFCLC